MKQKMNVRGGVDSLFTWIIALGLIVFIMVVFVFFTLLLFGTYSLTQDDELITEIISSPGEKNTLLLLQEEINVNGKNMRVMDGVYQQLDLFLSITNEEGKTVIALFGMQTPSSRLQQQMYSQGFDEDDWDALIEAYRVFQEGAFVSTLQKKLSLRCENYFLALPFGVVTRDGLKNHAEVSFNTDDESLRRYITQSYPFVYNNFYFTISFRMNKECLYE